MRIANLLLAVMLSASVCLAQDRVREGVVRGTVLKIGDAIVVIKTLDGGKEMTLHVGFVKNDAGKSVPNKRQLELLGTLKPGDKIVAACYVGDRAPHMIREMRKLGEDGSERGRIVRGSVVKIGDAKVVIKTLDGGKEMTLDVGFVKNDAGKSVRNSRQLELLGSLKPGDKIVAAWYAGDLAPHMIREMAKLGEDGKSVRRKVRRDQPKQGGDTSP